MTVGSVDGYPGDTVTLYVTLENNPGFSAASVKIEFNDTDITLTDAELCGGLPMERLFLMTISHILLFVKSENVMESDF